MKLGSLCYQLIQSTTLSYTAAASACAAEGGLLAAPKTELIHNELTALNTAGIPDNFWVGLDDRSVLGANICCYVYIPPFFLLGTRRTVTHSLTGLP